MNLNISSIIHIHNCVNKPHISIIKIAKVTDPGILFDSCTDECVSVYVHMHIRVLQVGALSK